jgi:hypothetical protein
MTRGKLSSERSLRHAGALAIVGVILVAYWALSSRGVVEISPVRTVDERVAAQSVRPFPVARELDVSPTPRVASRAISGSVQSSLGLPLSASVCIKDTLQAPWLDCKLSSASGRFELRDAQASASALLVSAPGHVSQLVELPLKGDVEMRIALAAGGSVISGRVRDVWGGEIVGAGLTARWDGQVLAAAISDATGQFELSVSSSQVLLTASADGYAGDTRSVAAPRAEIVLELTPESAIQGLVVDADSGAALAGVAVIAENRTYPTDLRDIETDETGAFALTALPAGNYELVVSGAEWRSDPLAIHVGPGEQRQSVTLRAVRAVSLRARVTLRGGAPCRGGSLDLSGPTWSPQALDGSEEVEIQGLLPGRYEVEISCPGALTLRDVLEVKREPLARHWELESGLLLGGSVVTHSGAPVAAATVDMMPIGEPLERRNVQCTTDEQGKFACAGLEAGAYDCMAGENAVARVQLPDDVAAPLVLRLAPTGALRVSARSASARTPSGLTVLATRNGQTPVLSQRAGDVFIFERLSLGQYSVYAEESPEISERVNLSRDGEVLEVVLTLPEATTISGSVIDEQGSPVPDAWVRATMSGSEFGFSIGIPVLTDAEGRFTIEGLLERKYDLRATGDGTRGELKAVAAGDPHVRVRVASILEASLTAQ